MKSLAIGLLTILSFSVQAQKVYSSSLTTKHKEVTESVEIKREISISDTLISITKFIGGEKPLRLKVNKVENKKDEWGSERIWYYCKTIDKDPMNNQYREFIILMEKTYPTEMAVYQKLDEVTFIKTRFSLR